jgi:hypothetical protein
MHTRASRLADRELIAEVDKSVRGPAEECVAAARVSIRGRSRKERCVSLAPVSVAAAVAVLCTPLLAAGAERYDVIVRGGTVYDGTGRPGRRADIGNRADRIAAIGDLERAEAATVLDARGLAVAPGFINMLSWSTESLIVDGRSQGEIRQGVTPGGLRRGAAPWGRSRTRLSGG